MVHREICEFREKLILKIGLFHRFKELFKSNQTRNGVSPGNVDCKTKRIFGIACLRKKLAFHTEICYYSEYLIFKYSIFHRVKELFKSNQNRYWVSPGYVKCKTKRVFVIACLGKKLVFYTEICEFREYLIWKISLFHRVNELFKSNETRYGISQGHVKRKTKRIAGISCLGKKLVFHTEICEFCDYLIWEKVFFIGSRNCSNQTKLGMQYPKCIESVKQNEVLV